MLSSAEYQRCIIKCVNELYKSLKIHSGTFLISGATGMIGSVIVDYLLKMNDECEANFNVIALAKGKQKATDRLGVYFERKDFRFVACDVNKTLPEMGDVTYLIHAASNTHPLTYSTDPIGTIRTNVIGTENLLAYARTHKCKRFIFLSSVEIYGESREEGESFEETDFGYLDCNQLRAGYPESKRVGESLCCAYAAEYGMDIVIPRLCRVYGPTMWQDDSKAVAQFIKKAMNNEDIILKSDGKQYYSYIHVIDAVKAIFYILDKGQCGEAYNISSTLSNIKLRELGEKVAEIAGTKVIYELPDETEKKGYSRATTAVLDNTKLRRLGWRENYDIDEGLQMTVRILKELKEAAEK